MKTYVINAAAFTDKKTAHRAMQAAMPDCEYYGANADALHDVLTAFGEPTEITVLHFASAKQNLGTYADILTEVFTDAQRENPNLHIIFKENDTMTAWEFYTAKEIEPAGWMKRQLALQADGLNGNLDKMWPDVKDSAWIGGKREGWERVPYWLDGFVPLAFLLHDEDKIARAQKYIDAILAGQRSDGWICPCTEEEIPTYDTWAVQLISKVLLVYYQCSGAERIPDALYRLMKNYYELLESGKIHLFAWAKSRWFEAFPALNFLYARHKEDWMCALARLLKEQGLDYAAMAEEWKRPINRWTHQTHVVNLAMMIKAEAVSCGLLHAVYGDEAEKLLDVLLTYNGTPVGLFTGDECLSGLSPIQGTELCAVAELMYSYELLFAQTGDKKWAERLEMLAFNALPATISDDMWTHQYDQQSNQIACEKFPGRSLFRTNGPESHLFGLEPNYGCCTANFGQAWPKFMLSAFMHRENEVISAVPVPCTLQTEGICVKLETAYPFENTLRYCIEPGKAFTLVVRIPSFAQNVCVNGEAASGDELRFAIPENVEVVKTITFTAPVKLIPRPHELYAVQCGSLMFSLPISYRTNRLEYERDGVERKFPYCDYELIGTSDWQFGYSAKDFSVTYGKVSDIPFSSQNPPVTVKAKVKPIAWGLEDGFTSVAAKVPESREPVGEEQQVTLYPYGCAKLRMTELPLV